MSLTINKRIFEKDGTEADILVVDDTPDNLMLLSMLLNVRGYKVRQASSGDLALQSARELAPDLILLDVSMPGLSGYDVAGLLKQDQKLCDIPIIFLSGKTETLDKVRAFAAGGVDYITKPFHFEEVAVRVETHLKIRSLMVEREKRNRELQQSNDALARLQELRDNLTHMIVHDLRSPLAALSGFLELCALQEKKTLSNEGALYLSRSRAAAHKLLEMVNSLLDVSQMEAGRLALHPTDCDLATLAGEVFRALESLRQERQFVMDVPATPVIVLADHDLILRVIQNLVGNALKFAPNGSVVRVTIQASETLVRVSVKDSGRGVPPEFHARIFEKFGQVKTGGGRVGTGLGLTFCKLAVEAHGGRIGLESQPGQGSVFWFEIPYGKKPQASSPQENTGVLQPAHHLSAKAPEPPCVLDATRAA